MVAAALALGAGAVVFFRFLEGTEGSCLEGAGGTMMVAIVALVAVVVFGVDLKDSMLVGFVALSNCACSVARASSDSARAAFN